MSDLPTLIGQCLSEIGRLAYLFAGEPDCVVEEALAAMRYQLEDTMPADTVDRLVDAVMRCKVEIERRGFACSVSRH
jgi:hypothetical protein